MTIGMREWFLGLVHACEGDQARCGRRMSKTAKVTRNAQVTCGGCVRELRRESAAKR